MEKPFASYDSCFPFHDRYWCVTRKRELCSSRLRPVARRNGEKKWGHSPFPFGDHVTYEVAKDKDGRLRADHVRPVGLEEASYQSNIKSRRNPRARRSLPVRSMGRAILLVAVASYAGWSYFKGNQSVVMPSVFKPHTEPAENLQSPAFQCDGRVHCSEMRSRAEAEFFIKHCPNTKMDGDNDGDPCENDSRF
jgi:hypothetical protein